MACEAVRELRVVMMSSSSSRIGGRTVNGLCCVGVVIGWVEPGNVDGNMGWVSYSSVDWILLMGGVGGAEERLEASVVKSSMCVYKLI